MSAIKYPKHKYRENPVWAKVEGAERAKGRASKPQQWQTLAIRTPQNQAFPVPSKSEFMDATDLAVMLDNLPAFLSIRTWHKDLDSWGVCVELLNAGNEVTKIWAFAPGVGTALRRVCAKIKSLQN